jgi:flagellar motor switch protein FliM
MVEVLSQNQIDELLGNIQSGETNLKEIEEQSLKKVKDYDFRSPKKFTKEQLKTLNNVFDNFIKFFELQLSSMLRVGCVMEIVQIEEEEFRDYNNALNDSVLMGIINIENKEIHDDSNQFIIEVARPLSFCIIDRLLGGDGSYYKLDREYTGIELSLIEYMFEQITQQLTTVWRNYGDLEHRFDMIETNSRLIQFISPDETTVIVVIETTIDNLKGNINICLPSNVLDIIFKMFDMKFVKEKTKQDMDPDGKRKDMIMQSLQEAPLTVTGVLGETEIKLQELLSLQKGDVLLLNKEVKDGSVDIKIEDIPWFTATMGKNKNNYAVRIEQVREG